VTPDRLPETLPARGDRVLYTWHGHGFALHNLEPRRWSIRDDDSTTLGHLHELGDGTHRFVGSKHIHIPDIENSDWRTIVAFASVPFIE
jgi:hypothetical protein